MKKIIQKFGENSIFIFLQVRGRQARRVAITCPLFFMFFFGFSQTWVQKANIPQAKANPSKAFYNSNFYLTGGSNVSSELDSTYEFNPSNNSWQALPVVPTGTGEAGSAVLNGNWYVVAGWDGSQTNYNFVYNFNTATWSSSALLPQNLSVGKGVAYNGLIYYIGSSLGNTTTYFYSFNPLSNQWNSLPNRPNPGGNAVMVVYDTLLYVFGGGVYYNGVSTVSKKLDIYNFSTGVWSAGLDMPVGLIYADGDVFNNEIYIVGGMDSITTGEYLHTSSIAKTFVYNINSNTYTYGPNIPISGGISEAAVISGDGGIYVFGGADSTDNILNSTWELQFGCTQTIYDTVTVYDTTHVTIQDTVYTSISVADTLIINVNLTGIVPPNNINSLTVYPNPAHNQLIINNGNFSSMAGYTLKITNSQGQTVFSQVVNQQQFDIDISAWSHGVYVLYVIDPSQTTKDVKEIVLQ